MCVCVCVCVFPKQGWLQNGIHFAYYVHGPAVVQGADALLNLHQRSKRTKRGWRTTQDNQPNKQAEAHPFLCGQTRTPADKRGQTRTKLLRWRPTCFFSALMRPFVSSIAAFARAMACLHSSRCRLHSSHCRAGGEGKKRVLGWRLKRA